MIFYFLILQENIEKLCPLCQDRFSKNPLRILDCKNEDCKEITKNAPKILDYICEDCSTHFESVKALLKDAGVEYGVDAGIVRGLDYYTKTVFEFVTTALGSQGTVCGGGRYDNLISQLGGNPTCGVGFGMGLERILMLMEATGVEIPKEEGVKVFIASAGDKATEKAFEICYKLRLNGVVAETDHMQRGLKPQMKYSNKIGARYTLVLGDSEIETGNVKLKNMESGEQIELDINKIADFFKEEK